MCTFDAILVILRKKNLKQKDLTDYLGLTKNAFTNWKAGRNESWKKYLPQIAEFLGVSVDELLGVTPVIDLQTKRLADLISQLDERDKIKLEGIIEVMLQDEKYLAPPQSKCMIIPFIPVPNRI